MAAVLETSLRFPKRRGKVRDVYDLGDRLLLIATDRISAFDWVLPNGIPDKGRVLTGLSRYWFETLGVPNHLISDDIREAGLGLNGPVLDALIGRSLLVRKAEVVPFECVVRGYLSGSGWREYREHGTVCGEPLPAGLVESGKIDPPIFTPATKAVSGHDENLPFADMARAVGEPRAQAMRQMSLEAYEKARTIAATRGLILADTKFELGVVPTADGRGEELIFVDEMLTPDSSRYWPAESYAAGGPQPSFDKQFVRDWLETTGWDKASPPPALPPEVVDRTRAKYIQAYELLTGQTFPWT